MRVAWQKVRSALLQLPLFNRRERKTVTHLPHELWMGRACSSKKKPTYVYTHVHAFLDPRFSREYMFL